MIGRIEKLGAELEIATALFGEVEVLHQRPVAPMDAGTAERVAPEIAEGPRDGAAEGGDAEPLVHGFRIRHGSD